MNTHIQNTENWKTNLDNLKDMHQGIVESIGTGKVCYIDIPLHYNVGDLLIYLGTENFFRDYSIVVKYRAFLKNVSRREIHKSDVILFHGGGNFGDIYQDHQSLRENIVKKFKDKRIIILPQTIYFESEKKMEESARIFREHKDLIFYVRDKKSYDLAQLFTSKVFLMPDMAHSLHPLIDDCEVYDTNKPVSRVINLRRNDKEKKSTIGGDNIAKKSFDWVDMISLSDVMILKSIIILQRIPFIKNKLDYVWKRHSSELVFRAVQYFMAHDEVYTDRMHGFILAYLCGKKVFIFDNSYGKNSTYVDAWIDDNELVDKCWQIESIQAPIK